MQEFAWLPEIGYKIFLGKWNIGSSFIRTLKQVLTHFSTPIYTDVS